MICFFQQNDQTPGSKFNGLRARLWSAPFSNSFLKYGVFFDLQIQGFFLFLREITSCHTVSLILQAPITLVLLGSSSVLCIC